MPYTVYTGISAKKENNKVNFTGTPQAIEVYSVEEIDVFFDKELQERQELEKSMESHLSKIFDKLSTLPEKIVTTDAVEAVKLLLIEQITKELKEEIIEELKTELLDGKQD